MDPKHLLFMTSQRCRTVWQCIQLEQLTQPLAWWCEKNSGLHNSAGSFPAADLFGSCFSCQVASLDLSDETVTYTMSLPTLNESWFKRVWNPILSLNGLDSRSSQFISLGCCLYSLFCSNRACLWRPCLPASLLKCIQPRMYQRLWLNKQCEP